MISGGNFVARLAEHFGLLTEQRLQGLTMIVWNLPMIDMVKLERECKLYDAFDKFSHIKEESLHLYYLRFTQLINDMNIYKMKLEQFQVNTTFLNSLPPEWSKFVTNVKLIDSDLAVPVFKQGDDHIDVINKMMLFLSTFVSSFFHTTNNQLRNSSNLRQQETIHDRRVTVQPVQGRQSSFAAGTSRQGLTSQEHDSGQQRVVKCFNCQGEGSGKVLNEEELEFLADPIVVEGLATQIVITYNAAYQVNNLDAYDSDCDDFSTAKFLVNVLPHNKNLFDEQAFRSRNLHPNIDQSASSPATIEAHWALPKITPDALKKGDWGFEHTKAVL
nr:hypothetical protein [Tanacetum cinerariifolium]